MNSSYLIRDARRAVWVSAAVLFLEALFGRSFPLLTVLAIVVLCVAFLVFIAALILEGTSWPSWQMESIYSVPVMPPSVTEPPRAAGDQTGKVPAQVIPAERVEPTESIAADGIDPASADSISRTLPAVPAVKAVEPIAVGPDLVEPISHEVEQNAVRSSGRVATERVSDKSRLLQTICLGCQQPIKSGQLVARCFVCGASHHATCWMENHFHCAREGCEGHGALEAPDEAAGA